MFVYLYDYAYYFINVVLIRCYAVANTITDNELEIRCPDGAACVFNYSLSNNAFIIRINKV